MSTLFNAKKRLKGSSSRMVCSFIPRMASGLSSSTWSVMKSKSNWKSEPKPWPSLNFSTAAPITHTHVTSVQPLHSFELERYFAKYEFVVPHLLCSSDCEPIAMSEVIALADEEVSELWRSLKLAYTESKGHPLLLKEIASLYLTHDQNLNVVTGVPQELIYLFMKSILSGGERVVSTYPGYQSLTEVALSLGCTVDAWTPEESADGKDVWFDVDKLESIMNSGDPTSLLVVNFPHNPTGALLTRSEQSRVIDLCKANGTILFSDEMYRGLERSEDRRLTSACDVYDRAVSLAGMSKVYGMPGVRIGWLAFGSHRVLGDVFERVCSLKDYTTICAPGPSEILALAGLRSRDRLLKRCRKICEAGIDALEKLTSRHDDTFAWTTPPGGSTGFPKIQNQDAHLFTERVRNECGVLLLPGSAYLPGDERMGKLIGFGSDRVRLAYGRADVPQVVETLGKWLDSELESPYN